MSISIIIDKSTFQSLSFDELTKLSRYYKHNVAPVLVLEILGDLKKEVAEGKTPSDIRVKDFANKLFPVYSTVNSYYRSLIKHELTSGPFTMDGRPNVDIEKTIDLGNGKKGKVIRESVEEKSIYKWKNGEFTKADTKLSQVWRTITTHEDLLKNLQKILQSKEYSKLKSFEELNESANAILSSDSLHDRLLAYMIDNYGAQEIDGSEVFKKWTNQNRPHLSEFAPYSFHCLRVDLLFHLGLQSDLISVRPTNRVDLEYLYYLPFCNVFTSNDKLHKNLVPILIKEDQKFIVGADLKKDFKQIVEYLEKEGEEAKKKYVSEPPINEKSLTFQLWKEYLDYPNQSDKNADISDETLERLKSEMDMIIKASEGEQVDFEGSGIEDFYVRKSFINENDPCFCGSGKILKECCVPRDEFISGSKKNKEK